MQYTHLLVLHQKLGASGQRLWGTVRTQVLISEKTKHAQGYNINEQSVLLRLIIILHKKCYIFRPTTCVSDTYLGYSKQQHTCAMVLSMS